LTLRLNYGPRLKQLAYKPLELDSRLNILEGTVRSGKTWALQPKILRACRYPVKGWRLITGVSKQTIFANVLNDLFNLIGTKHYKYNHQSGLLRLFDSYWMVMGAKDEGSEKYIRGMTVGVAVCDEVTLMPHEFFQMLLTRLSPEGARLYGTTNCDSPKHWLKVELLDNEPLRKMGVLSSMHVTMDDNPNLSEEYKRSLRTLYKGLFYERYILGLWVMAEGAIYRDVLGSHCRFDEDSRPAGLYSSFAARYIGVDYGTTNPCVFLDVYDDAKWLWQDNEYYWDSETMQRQKTDSEYADDMIEFIGPNKRGVIVVVDPSAASFKTELIKRGLLVKDAKNEVQEGIRKVSSALKTGLYRIHSRCKKTLSEMENYSWDKNSSQKGIEKPIKSNDHCCDGVRYVIHTMVPGWRIG